MREIRLSIDGKMGQPLSLGISCHCRLLLSIDGRRRDVARRQLKDVLAVCVAL